MKSIFLTPLDVWLFRDGRPFNAGSDHRAQSVFPPYPSVIQGAIRSHYAGLHAPSLSRNPANKKRIEDLVGTDTDYKGLRLRGPFLAHMDSSVMRYFPQPANAYTHKNSRSLKLASPPQETPADCFVSSPLSGLRWMGMTDELGKGREGLWLPQDALLDYLDGKTVEGVEAKELFERENRYGVGIQNSSSTAAEGLLYEVEYVRPSLGVGLLVELDDTLGYADWPDEGVLQMGGEGRAAYYKKEQTAPWPKLPAHLPGRFMVYFATPAYFEQGWLPATWDRFFDGPVTLRAAALNRYESMGGFDYARQWHKAARRFVPAGSVYYFENQGATQVSAAYQAITEYGAEIGFGQIIIPQKEW